MPTPWKLVLGVIAAIAAIAACGDGSSKGSPPFPKIADYDRSCAVDSDCRLVPGEGCGACYPAALNARAAPDYTAAQNEAAKSPECRNILAAAGACRPPTTKDEVRCQASLCIAQEVVLDAGRD